MSSGQDWLKAGNETKILALSSGNYVIQNMSVIAPQASRAHELDV